MSAYYILKIFNEFHKLITCETVEISLILCQARAVNLAAKLHPIQYNTKQCLYIIQYNTKQVINSMLMMFDSKTNWSKSMGLFISDAACAHDVVFLHAPNGHHLLLPYIPAVLNNNNIKMKSAADL